MCELVIRLVASEYQVLSLTGFRTLRTLSPEMTKVIPAFWRLAPQLGSLKEASLPYDGAMACHGSVYSKLCLTILCFDAA